MSKQLFSQIPAQILSKANIITYDNYEPRKRVRFSDVTPRAQEIEISDQISDEVDIEDLTEELTNEQSSSSTEQELLSASPPAKKQYSDAIVQADFKPKTCDRITQTELSLLMTDDELYRIHKQAQQFEIFKPMYSIPKHNGRLPPLKLGLTLPKGRKRKVYYPDEENGSAN